MTDEQKPQEEREPTPASKSGLDQIAKYSELAMLMPAGCAGGWIVGSFLDHKFNTHWMFLAGLALGFVGGFVQVIRIALKS